MTVCSENYLVFHTQLSICESGELQNEYIIIGFQFVYAGVAVTLTSCCICLYVCVYTCIKPRDYVIVLGACVNDAKSATIFFLFQFQALTTYQVEKKRDENWLLQLSFAV